MRGPHAVARRERWAPSSDAAAPLPEGEGRRARGRLRRGRIARPVAGARRTLRRPRTGRRAGARPSRRAADRAQPLRHRSARGADPQRLGDRAARGRGGPGPLRAGPWRLAEAHRHRPLGLGDHAHRRRRSCAGLRAHRLPADLGRFVQPRQRLRGFAAGDAGPAAGRCDVAHFRPLPRRLSEPDRALRRRRSRCRGAARRAPDDNPLAGLEGASLARVFGAAPGAYGVGLGRRIAEGDWAERSELAEAYLAATSHAYDGEGEGAGSGGGLSTPRRRRRGLRSRPGPAGSGRARRRRLRRA